MNTNIFKNNSNILLFIVDIDDNDSFIDTNNNKIIELKTYLQEQELFSYFECNPVITTTTKATTIPLTTNNGGMYLHKGSKLVKKYIKKKKST